ncbi:MAG TPA: hypothetical protein VK826_12430 [Bacteroidia bacterium]|nr:hypothetical protein [Bacteroidia bacterium]
MKKNIFHRLSWKQKNKILLGSFLFVAWIVYSSAISNTLDAKSMGDELRLQLDSATGAPEKLQRLKTELVRFEELTGQGDSAAVHEQLLDRVTLYCGKHPLQLREFAQPIRYRQQEWIVETHPFTIEGSFVEIVKFMDYLGTQSTGKIVSADIHSKTDNKTKTVSLLVTIYVQNISNAS